MGRLDGERPEQVHLHLRIGPHRSCERVAPGGHRRVRGRHGPGPHGVGSERMVGGHLVDPLCVDPVGAAISYIRNMVAVPDAQQRHQGGSHSFPFRVLPRFGMYGQIRRADRIVQVGSDLQLLNQHFQGAGACDLARGLPAHPVRQGDQLPSIGEGAGEHRVLIGAATPPMGVDRGVRVGSHG